MRFLRYSLVLAVVVYLLTGVKQVRPGERAVVRRFGQVAALPGPGLWIGLPYGLDRVDLVSVEKVRSVQVGFQPSDDDSDEATPPGQLLTGDHNLVNVQLTLDYTVGATDRQLVDYVVQGDRVAGVLARAAEAVLAEWIASKTVDEVLIRGKTELPLLLVDKIQERTEPYRLGIALQSASVAYLQPPNRVKDAFDQVGSAQAAIRTSENVARQLASRRLRQAETERDTIEKQTAASVKERLLLARAEAERFTRRLQEYQRLRVSNPYILAGIWWEEIGKLLAQLKNDGRLDLLDNHLGADGLDISIAPSFSKKR